jgi:hypothetical protein
MTATIKNMTTEKFHVVIQSDSKGGHRGAVKSNLRPYADHISKRFASLDNCKAEIEIWINDNLNVPLSQVQFISVTA